MKCQCWNIGFFSLHQFEFFKIERHYNDHRLWSNLLIGNVSWEVQAFDFWCFPISDLVKIQENIRTGVITKTGNSNYMCGHKSIMGIHLCFLFYRFADVQLSIWLFEILSIGMIRYLICPSCPNADHCLRVWLPLAIPLSNACVVALFYLPNGS